MQFFSTSLDQQKYKYLVISVGIYGVGTLRSQIFAGTNV